MASTSSFTQLAPSTRRSRRGRKLSRKKAEDRPRLTQQDVDKLAIQMRETYGWDSDVKDFQLAAVKAQIEGVDIIVQAPTGPGKTALAAGPHLWGWKEKKFTIMVCPLLSLEEEMEQTFDTDFKLKVIALNSKNGACSPLTLREILAFKYQIILVSPEMLQSRTFTDRILRNSHFMSYILSMFIDEAHCIVHWGADFRKKYGTLGKIRAFLPLGTPVIAVTATLTARVRRAIHTSLHFGQSNAPSRFINKGNDRPNVSIIVRACEHPLNTFADLNFVIPSTLRTPSDIPKTYIYVDNIAHGAEIIDRLNARLESHPDVASAPGGSGRFRGIVRPFNATMSAPYRTLAMAHFRHVQHIRILVCTDAAGMGCNIPDIDRVVQWKLPTTFSHFIQRAGRAARGRGRTGVAVLLVERSAYSINLITNPPASMGAKEKDARKKKTIAPARADEPKPDRKEVREYAHAHGVERGGSNKLDPPPKGRQPSLNPECADEGLLTFVQSTSCRRAIWAQAFESPLTIPCCDICDPTLLDTTRPLRRPPESRAKNIRRGQPHGPTSMALREWRRAVYSRDHTSAPYDASGILDNILIKTLPSCGPLTVPQISSLLEDKWIFWGKYGSELTAFLATLTIP
ncbi:P-loop containing nucleoside triphosphate hydrolase protein, partial [Dichomitus squalens LYAD-421 SS1]|uniref:P-loop containing nucleoside triphosphate hydrolase protein n=1 Tax=Dichomitus squalens (strain LYAD-421) TaxID=732165 RepID=UPI0004410843